MSHSKQDILNQIDTMKTWRVNAETAAVGKGFSDVSTAHDISTFAGEFGGCYPGAAEILTDGTFYTLVDGAVSIPMTVHAKSGRITANNNMSISDNSSIGTGEYTLTASLGTHSPVFSGAPSFGFFEFRVQNGTGLDSIVPKFVVKPGV